jgi:hypothetical protein
MFAGFNLSTNNNFTNYQQIGNKIFSGCKDQIEKELKKFTLSNGSLDGTKMQSNWFPQINADIFISHSHKDESRAIGLAGWLNYEFGLDVFIDSCVWGYSIELLKIIDDEYCLSADKGTYDYQKRNYSTSHVHMMLSTALTMMMDKAECVFFLNTPNSIETKDLINKTESPWIYYEIAMTKLVRNRSLKEYRDKLIKKALFESAQNAKELNIKYEVTLDHLHSINQVDIDNWRTTWNAQLHKEDYPLDVLYKRKNIIKE